MKRLATLEELDRRWTLEDIYKGNALLDMQADIDAADAPKPKGGRK
jgi:hypothetical protein